MNELKFSNGNAKLEKGIAIFSLPAGHSCPCASLCKSKLVKKSGNAGGYGVQDGPDCKFRCFAATDEAMYPSVRKQRWHNFNLLKSCKSKGEMVEMIKTSLPQSTFNLPVRIHSSGDFFSQMYLDAWIEVAKSFPERVFYGYTKSLHFLVKRLNVIPDNFRLTASYGGKFDSLIIKYNLKSATVVFSVEEAQKLNLEIDHDDSLAYKGNNSFALLLHGSQPAGSPAASAWSALKKIGIGGYDKQKSSRIKIKTGGGTTPAVA